MKQRLEVLSNENSEMSHIISSFRNGNYNASEGAKLIADERLSRFQDEIASL